MPDAGESATQVGTIRAPAQTVFAAWTEAAQRQRWLAPIAEADGRVGGHFRLEVRAPDGSHIVTGVYRELVPGRRIVMTWVYEGPMVPDGKEPTQVTVEFRPSGSNTDVRVHHEGLKNPAYRETIRQGAWTEALAQLDSILSA
jgi:uncharacterized protein YndB with AHSA1/START domain